MATLQNIKPFHAHSQHNDLASLLAPAHRAAPALFIALKHCLAALENDDPSYRAIAIAEGHNAMRFAREVHA